MKRCMSSRKDPDLIQSVSIHGFSGENDARSLVVVKELATAAGDPPRDIVVSPSLFLPSGISSLCLLALFFSLPVTPHSKPGH